MYSCHNLGWETSFEWQTAIIKDFEQKGLNPFYGIHESLRIFTVFGVATKFAEKKQSDFVEVEIVNVNHAVWSLKRYRIRAQEVRPKNYMCYDYKQMAFLSFILETTRKNKSKMNQVKSQVLSL